MALTLTRVPFGADSTGKFRRRQFSITGDNAPPAGGYSVTGLQIGARNGSIIGVNKLGGNALAQSYGLSWDTANSKLVFTTSAGGQMAYVPGGGDIKGATNPAGTEGNADQNATAVNGVLFLAATTFTVLAGTMTPTVQPDVPRNILIQIQNDSGGALDLFEGVTTFLITGTDVNGLAQTESVTLTSSAGNKSVANTKFRYVQGVKPFKTVTSVAITNAPAGALKGSLGPGTRLGLPQPLLTPAVADVDSITVNAAAVTPGATTTSAGGVDTTNNAINAGTLADGADVAIIYSASGAVAPGTDLSGVVMKAEFITST
jgi:hypothetical protein